MTDTTHHHAGPDTEGCVCGGCGLIPVDEDYVSRQAAKRVDPETGAIPAGLLEALRDSYRPCHSCRPEQYESWASGNYSASQGTSRGRGTRRTYRRRRAD